MKEFNEIVADISIYSVLLPIAAGVFSFRNANRYQRLFVFFLVWGALVDQYSNYVDDSNPLFNIYGLTEAVFYFWLVNKIRTIVRPSREKFVFLFLVVLFISCHLLTFNSLRLEVISSWFVRIVSLPISAMAAYSMLKKTEMNAAFDADFIFLAGIFVYYFCTNFIFSFIEDHELTHKIWWIHNLINILCYLIFTKAFLSIPKKTIPEKILHP